MNIKDLPQNSYTVEPQGILNVNNLPQDSFSFENGTSSIPTIPNQGLSASLWSRLAESLKTRRENFNNSVQNESLGKTTKAETVLSGLGQGIAFAGDVAGEALKPSPDSLLGQIIKGASEHSTPFAQNLGKQLSSIGELYKIWASKPENQRVAQNLESSVPIASLLLGGTGAGQAAEDLALGAVKFGKTLVSTAEETALALKSVTPSLVTLDALTPELSSKKLTNAYKEVVTGKRTLQESGILTGQQLSNPEEVKNLADSLSDISFVKDPAKNLNLLGNDLKQTETRLTTLLEADKTPIVKESLTDTLDNLNAELPREYRGIKDSETAFKNVIDFAKEKVLETEPTVNGLRNARIAFDNQARKEFPNAFKEAGFIDTKTPAGRAIKLGRDTINDYAYNTAEKGSELQKLIKREADIFKANEIIAPKASTFDQKNFFKKFYIQHPVISKIIGGAGAAEIIKHGTGFDIPIIP